MFRSNLAAYPYISPINTYGDNLKIAAKTFVAALFAIDPSKLESGAHEAGRAHHDQQLAYDELYRLADQFEPIMPNQAAELRFLAGTDAGADSIAH